MGILGPSVTAQIIHVPGDQPTIQAGIDSAANGDTVLVDTGLYEEHITIDNKSITLASWYLPTQDSSFISETVIDGSGNGGVVTVTNVEGSVVFISGFTLENGYSTEGGGVYCFDANLNIDHAIIQNNSSYNGGGGVYAEISDLVMDNCIIQDNYSMSYIGGGAYLVDSRTDLFNVTICGNSSVYGGGIFNFRSKLNAQNVLFYNNIDNNNGASYSGSLSVSSFINCTILGDSTAPPYHSISNMSFYNDTVTIMDCIIWSDNDLEIYLYGSEQWPCILEVSWSDVRGGESGVLIEGPAYLSWEEGNLDEDPLFSASGDHPYSLSEGSPCIDSGIPDTTGLNLPPWDIMGNFRIWDGDGNGDSRIDMGAYEYGALPVGVQEPADTRNQTAVRVYPNPSSGVSSFGFRASGSEHVTLKIYDLQGREMATVVDEVMPAGEHTVSIDMGSLPPGVYLYRISNIKYGASSMGKLVVVR